MNTKHDNGSGDEKPHGGKVSMVAPEEVHHFSGAGFRSLKMHSPSICLAIALRRASHSSCKEMLCWLSGHG